MLLDEAASFALGAAGGDRGHRDAIAAKREPIIQRARAPLENDIGSHGVDFRLGGEVNAGLGILAIEEILLLMVRGSHG